MEKISVFSLNTGKYTSEKNLYLDTFQAVFVGGLTLSGKNFNQLYFVIHDFPVFFITVNFELTFLEPKRQVISGIYS